MRNAARHDAPEVRAAFKASKVKVRPRCRVPRTAVTGRFANRGEVTVRHIASRTLASLARLQDERVLGFVDRLIHVAAAENEERRAVTLAGLSSALEALDRRSDADPLSVVDAPMSAGEQAAALALVGADAAETRRRLLAQCVASGEAARFTERSRQSLERMRRAGRALALREGNQWRYPQWQFDKDAARGLLPGLDKILAELRLSPVGAAVWLTRPHPALNARPVDLLRSRNLERVLQAARERAHRP